MVSTSTRSCTAASSVTGMEESVERPGPAEPDEDIAADVAAVESLPLDQRASRFAALHDELRDRLEDGDAPRA